MNDKAKPMIEATLPTAIRAKIRDIFHSGSDCYADTTKVGPKGEHIEGDVVMAMSEEKFVEVVSDIAEGLIKKFNGEKTL